MAPPELIRSDFEVLRSYEHLETTNEIEELLFIQSLEGRAHNGAGMFGKHTYVNTTIEDVVKALNRDPDLIKAKRQDLIDDILEYARSAMDGEKRERLINRHGRPFLGLNFFNHRRVNARDVLRGLYMGGLRDNPDVRKVAEDLYRIRIGGGRCYIVDVHIMMEMGLDGEQLAHQAHEERIEEYRRRGLIVTAEGAADIQTQRYFYIRHRIGPGQSDDGAMIMAGLLFNVDVALGVFLADAIDTLEKYAPIYKDQDGSLAFEIGRGFKDLRVSDEDVSELISLAAIPEVEEQMVPDSSLRYLLAIDPRTNQSALRNHLDFVEGKPVVEVPVSYKRIPSTDFYEYINRRLMNIQKLEKLAVPNFTVQQLGRPVTEVVSHNFAVLPKDAAVSDAMRKFKETKCDLLVIQDKSGKIVG
ncbi:MAG: hypothetical protein WCG06_02715, partial [Candidatus Omnitrophota bacterium]